MKNPDWLQVPCSWGNCMVKYLTVIKNVAYFPAQCALNSGPVMSAVLDSLQASGIATHENSMSADAAVVWSALWSGRMRGNRAVYQHYRQLGRPVIFVEVGALYRGNTWKISVNNITADGYYGHTEDLDWDRPKKLNISVAQPIELHPHVVLALQHTQSLQLADVDYAQWILSSVEQLRNHTDRHIVVRPHPRCRMPQILLPNDVEIQLPEKLINTYDSFDMRYNCHAVVNLNSGPGIQAAIAGIRPVVASNSLAAPVGVDFANIEQPYDVDRDLWLTEICHTEYTVEEIKRGLWIKRLESALM